MNFRYLGFEVEVLLRDLCHDLFAVCGDLKIGSGIIGGISSCGIDHLPWRTMDIALHVTCSGGEAECFGRGSSYPFGRSITTSH